MWNKEPKSIQEIIDKFPTERSCIEHLEKIRWESGNIISPFDFRSKVYKTNSGYQCKNTGKNFNVKTSTIYEGTRIPLVKWFCGTYILSKEPKISSAKFGYLLDLTQKSAWYMIKRIKSANLYLNEKEVSNKEVESINKVLNSIKIKPIL